MFAQSQLCYLRWGGSGLRHSSRIELHGQIGQAGVRRQQRETCIHHTHTFVLSHSRSEKVFWVPGLKKKKNRKIYYYVRCGGADAPCSTLGTVSMFVIFYADLPIIAELQLCLCDDTVVKQNSSQSDSRMLLGDAPKGTTRHWPTGWTQTCKWVIYPFGRFWNVAQPQSSESPFLQFLLNEM